MDLLLLQRFLRLASKLHFTQTSQELLVAQPALSRQIKQLEQQVHATLLKRSKRNVELTPAGKYFQQEVSQLLQHWERLSKRTGQIHRGEAGEIRIGYTNTALQTVLPAIIMHLKRQLPALKTTLSEMSNEVQLEALARKQIDLGFSTSPDVPEFLDSKLLLEDNFVVVLPEDHPLNQENFVSLSVFADEGFILPQQKGDNSYVRIVETICMQAGFSPRVVHETDYAITGLRLVEAGVGVTIEPKSGLRGQLSGIKYIELKDIPQKARLTMLWRKDLKQDSPLFFELLTQMQDNNTSVE